MQCPMNLQTNPPSFTVTLNLENSKCGDYYSFLTKFKHEKPKKWPKIQWIEEFDLEDKCISQALSLPTVFSEPYLRSFQYNVLNCTLFTNEILFKR